VFLPLIAGPSLPSFPASLFLAGCPSVCARVSPSLHGSCCCFSLLLSSSIFSCSSCNSQASPSHLIIFVFCLFFFVEVPGSAPYISCLPISFLFIIIAVIRCLHNPLHVCTFSCGFSFLVSHVSLFSSLYVLSALNRLRLIVTHRLRAPFLHL
jgi:hypothetical protein